MDHRGPLVEFRGARRPQGEVLEGARVTLIPVQAAHGAALFEAFRGADAAWDFMPGGPYASAPEMEAAMGRLAIDPARVAYAIRLRDRRVLGHACYWTIQPEQGVIEAGNIAFAPALQRHPAATEAMVLMMGHAFDLGYRRYEWKCNALNRASRRAAQRLGLSFEGIFRNHMVVKGRSRDTAWFAATDGEWPALKAAFARWLDPGNFDAEGRQRVALSALTAPLLHRRDPEGP